MKNNRNTKAVAKPFYTSTRSNETIPSEKYHGNENLIKLQQLAKQMERKYPRGYQGL
jgi:hypothetical protein